MLKNVNILLISCLIVTGVTSCNRDKNNKPVAGESFFETRQEKIAPSEAKSIVNNFSVPPAVANTVWLRNGYIPAENLMLNIKGDVNSESIGSSPKRGLNLTSVPVIAENIIFSLAGDGKLQARKADDISELLWEADIAGIENTGKKTSGYFSKMKNFVEGDGSSNFIGGNIVYDNGVLYLATKRGSVIAFNAKSGKMIWGVNAGVQIRSTPVTANGILAFTTIDNQTLGLASSNGRVVWKHKGMVANSQFMASPAPLIIGNIIIVTYSSGDIYGLNINDGVERWNSTVSKSAFGSLNMFGDISQSLVFHKGYVYIVSSDGTLGSIDGGGEQQWVLEGKSIAKAPWPVGDMLFAVTSYGELLAITAKTGQVVWQAKMADEEEKNRIFTGVVMANGKLFAADNKGSLYQYSPLDGKLADSYSIADEVYLTPVVANGKIYLLSNNSKLISVE